MVTSGYIKTVLGSFLGQIFFCFFFCFLFFEGKKARKMSYNVLAKSGIGNETPIHITSNHLDQLSTICRVKHVKVLNQIITIRRRSSSCMLCIATKLNTLGRRSQLW